MGPHIDAWFVTVVAVVGWINREQDKALEYLLAKNRVLKEQLTARGGRLWVTDKQRGLLAVKAKEFGRAALSKLDTIVCPDTLLRWHQQLIAQKYDGSAKRGPGRPRIMREIEALIVRMARENPSWGYTRIRGGLWNLGRAAQVLPPRRCVAVVRRSIREPPGAKCSGGRSCALGAADVSLGADCGREASIEMLIDVCPPLLFLLNRP